MAKWTDAALDALRLEGDPIADAVIAAVAKNGEGDTVRKLLAKLVSNDQVPASELPDEVEDYFKRTEPDLAGLEQVARGGERLFREFGPEILVILGCYSLPAAYAATKGVKVLAATGYLESNPTRRLAETTQMVVDVLSPGGLGIHGKGVRTAQKVRLMHATIRHLLLKPDRGSQEAWKTQALGVPINQEDLAGTLMTFSCLVLEGLEKLGCELTHADREAYLAAWVAIGRLLGVSPALLPVNFSEARELTAIIQRRQILDEPNPEGTELTAALLKMFEAKIPGRRFDFFASGMVRHFLPEDVADRLGVPALTGGSEEAAKLATLVGVGLAKYGRRRGRSLVRRFGLEVIQVLLLAQRGGTRAPFTIPLELREQWAEIEEEEPPWWVRGWRWLAGLVGLGRKRVRPDAGGSAADTGGAARG
jgi:hypothetical protein